MDSELEKPGQNKTENKEKERPKPKKKGIKPDYKCIITVALSSFVITLILSLLSNEAANRLNVIVSISILMFFIILGVVFDIIGLAVATCGEEPFHAMAARKIKTAKYAVSLIRNSERVVSFCSDVIGDIAGIVSGATASAIAVMLFTGGGSMISSLIITSLVASATVGLKAFGKSIATGYNVKIVDFISKVIYLFNRKK